MLVRQSRNTFIRIYDNGQLGYIMNQLTMFDRSYNDIGADFLSQISRTPKSIDAIVENLSRLYIDADAATLSADITAFLADLHKNRFIVMGESPEELDADDECFTYNTFMPKTRANKFTQITKDEPLYDTQEYLSRHDMENPRLVSLHLELTTRCNERCVHCYIPNDVKQHGVDMPLAKVKQLIDEFCNLNGLHIVISGGESLLHKDIREILLYCREKDLQISILSNFLNVNESLAKVLKEVNLSNMKVSLYSMDGKIHDSITQVKGSFGKTKTAILLLHSYDIPLEISCPLLKENFSGYKDVMEFAYSLKIKANTDLNLMAESDFNTENLSHNISLQDQESIMRDILETDANYAKMVGEDVYNSEQDSDFEDRSICGAGKSSLCVSANGDVCTCAGWGGKPLGNVFKEGLRHIWENNDRLKEYRKITFHSFPKCVKCEARDYCGLCLSQNFNESGGDVYKVPQRVCDTAFMNMRVAKEFRANYLKSKHDENC